MKTVVMLALSISLLGCKFFSKKSDDSPPASSQENWDLADDPEEPHNNNHVVMVVDDGIDPNQPSYKDKVLASYTLVCNSDSSGLDYSSPQAYKKSLLKKIDSSREYVFGSHCTLEEGIRLDLHTPPSHIMDKRKEWNYRIRKKEYDVVDKLREVYESIRSLVGKYHGTNVTAMIAYKNPNVRFVLVQVKLGSRGDSIRCADIRAVIPILNIIHDKDIQEAYRNKAVLSEWKIIDDLAKKHHVSLINKSYGLTRVDWVDELKHSQCDPRMVEPLSSFHTAYMTLENDLAKKMNIFYDTAPYLTIQAAGNDASRSDSINDNYFCSKAPNHLMVGSYNLNKGQEQISKFSTYGACVNLYSLGGNIITSNPFKFLSLTNGTSFATPLTVRYANINFSESMKPEEMSKELLARLDSRQFLPPSKHFRYAAFDEGPGQLKLAHKNIAINDESKELNRSFMELRMP